MEYKNGLIGGKATPEELEEARNIDEKYNYHQWVKYTEKTKKSNDINLKNE